MKTSRRASNGRSPLVNQQRQITSFFSKKTLSSPITTPKQNPCSNTDCSPSPMTPSPFQPKPKKPLLVIGPSPSSSSSSPDSSSNKSFGPEVVGRRIRVFWPLDQSWYEGCVQHFDEVSGKHLVLYDDADEELLNLSREKIEWLVEKPVMKRFRRLRRISVVEDDEENEGLEKEVNAESGGDDDDSADEDWGHGETKALEDVSEDMDLVDEDDGGKTSERSKKRKMCGGVGKPGYNSIKKRKNIGDTKQNACKVPSVVNGRKSIEPATRTVHSK